MKALRTKPQQIGRKPTINATAMETLIAIMQTSSYTKAAARLKIDNSTLHRRINKFGIKEILNSLPQQAYDQLRLGSLKAAEQLTELIDAEDENVSLKASESILDRVGVAKAPTVAVQMNQYTQGYKAWEDFTKEEQLQSVDDQFGEEFQWRKDRGLSLKLDDITNGELTNAQIMDLNEWRQTEGLGREMKIEYDLLEAEVEDSEPKGAAA